MQRQIGGIPGTQHWNEDDYLAGGFLRSTPNSSRSTRASRASSKSQASQRRPDTVMCMSPEEFLRRYHPLWLGHRGLGFFVIDYGFETWDDLPADFKREALSFCQVVIRGCKRPLLPGVKEWDANVLKKYFSFSERRQANGEPSVFIVELGI